jgi:hypothetical protein
LATKTKKRPERFALKVIKDGFSPADNYTTARLREKGFKIGDVIFAELKKPRNPRFHALGHALGSIVAHNIQAFNGMDAHKVLKRLQMEANIGCEEIAFNMPGVGMLIQRVPKSLSFESMDEGEFHEVLRGMCRHIAERYWPNMDAQQIEEMAELMVGE